MRVQLNLQKFPFPHKRGRVVFVITDGKRVLLHHKRIYPEGIFRLPSGTVKPNEDFDSALKREAEEEFGLKLKKDDYKKLEEIEYLINQKGNPIKYKEVIYKIKVDPKSLKINTKELGEIKWVGFEELLDIYRQLKWLKGEWKYWGKLRSVAVRIVYELYKKGKM